MHHLTKTCPLPKASKEWGKDDVANWGKADVF